ALSIAVAIARHASGRKITVTVAVAVAVAVTVAVTIAVARHASSGGVVVSRTVVVVVATGGGCPCESEARCKSRNSVGRFHFRIPPLSLTGPTQPFSRLRQSRRKEPVCSCATTLRPCVVIVYSYAHSTNTYRRSGN